MGRLVIVSMRLPYTVRAERGRVSLARSPGGLANGLRGPHERLGGDWIGWPGDVARLDDAQRASLDADLAARGCVPVHLTAGEIARFYEGFSNGVLWPLFHYLVDRVPIDTKDWPAYVRANERFAEAAAARTGEGDLAWVHDYQLALVPRMLRRRRPDARVGFFLHVPFPSAEVMRTMPWRREVLEGMLGADLVGFHTRTYLRHFAETCRLLLGADADEESVRIGGRVVRLGVFPMGVDARAISGVAREPALIAEAEALRPPGRMLLGIDRADYTKGIPGRLRAVQRMFERDPRLRGQVRLVQIAVPSREQVEAYRVLRREVEEAVGHITGAWATTTTVPIHYQYRNLGERQVIAHYRAADVMVVTPLRDGMNLVAKEFVAAREDEDGVLVLSELAGAAEELDAALKVNPYDVERMAQTFRRALAMPPAERRARMQALRARVFGYDVHAWAEGFIRALEEAGASATGPRPQPVGVDAVVEAVAGADPLTVLLDYDGTLVPIAPRPELAGPDDALFELLSRLAERADVHLVSGRPWSELDRWFGHLPIGLFAEHGLWRRTDPRGDWRRAETAALGWMDVVGPMMEKAAARIPGAFVERKTASLAFHWRLAQEPEEVVRDLRHQLHEMARWLPLDPLEGSCVLEARARGINKGIVAAALREEGRLHRRILAVGDDQTDEDLFAALPPAAVTVLVGDRPSLARLRVGDPAAVRAVLAAILERRRVPEPA
ncbi:MAG: bifunctional alpha,alpha-trehalose-phosphate synthase (UDP-forming)/trehalose-phosphatase [Myxococcota bacterium]